MKKLSVIFILCVSLFIAFAFVSCGEDVSIPPTPQTPSTDTQLKDITGVTFDDATFTYDGTQKEIKISGALPEGVTVSYSNNTATNAGTYSATATLSGTGYKTLVLNAKLTVNKATITGVSAELEQSVYGDGKFHLPTFLGEAPSGVTVKYIIGNEEKPNGVSAIGTYNFKIVFSADNYETLELPVTYKVKINALELAGNVINSFGSAPDPWALLPDSFAPEYHTVSTSPTYDEFINVSNIPTNVIGKQMDVVYGVLNKTTKAIYYVNIVVNSLNGIKSLYTTYLDSNPTDYQNYTDTIAGFTFTLELDEDSYLLRASIGGVIVELFSSVSDSTYGAKIKLTETTVLKYTVSEDSLLIAMDILDASTTQISFARNDDGHMVGIVYEYLTVAGMDITATSAMIEVGEKYTTVIGTKGDFIPTSVSRNCEIYDNETGALVGTEVREDLKGIVYNTYWFPLFNVSGIKSVMKIDQMNGDNADTIYINGVSDDTIHTKLMGISYGSKMLSRRYDIEFKTVYAYTYNMETEEYESVKFEIPMIFIQEEVISSFIADFKEKNSVALNGSTVDLLIEDEDFAAISRAYQILLPIYDTLKDAVTKEMIAAYCKE